MISDLLKAFNELPDPKFRVVILRTLVLSFFLLLILAVGSWYLLNITKIFNWSWLEFLTDKVGWLLALVVGCILFPGTVVFVMSFNLDSVILAVEKKHYADLAPAKNQTFFEALIFNIRYIGAVLTVNLLLVPVYFIPVLNLIIFGLANGYFIGREYFELIAPRRLEGGAVKLLQKRFKFRFWFAGIIISYLLVIPVLNFVVPMIAVTFMLHTFEKCRREYKRT